MPLIESISPWMFAVLALSLFIAGISKGLAGNRLPVLAIPITTLVVDLQTAVTLMPVSLVASNI